MMLSTSGNRSRDISTEAMFPSVTRASPTTYWFEWLRSLQRSARFRSNAYDKLLQRIRDQGQDLLVFVEEEHGSQVSQPLVGEPVRGQQLQTLNLAKVRALS